MKNFIMWFIYHFNKKAYRLIIYKKMYELMIEDTLSIHPNYQRGFCHFLSPAVRSTYTGRYFSFKEKNMSFIHCLPELYIYKKNLFNSMYWFPQNEEGRKIRLGILQAIINKM